MCTNDISSAVNVSSKMKSFAADVTLYATMQTAQDYQILQTDLVSISCWCNIWQLKLIVKYYVSLISNHLSILIIRLVNVRYIGVH